MCLIHFYHHSACGHTEQNWPLSIQCHCEAVEQALRFFHDQNAYHLLDEQLSTRYSMNTIENLQTPKACAARWPLPLPSPDPYQYILPQQYWDWVAETMADLQGASLHNDNLPPSLPRQHRLDSISQHKKDSGKRRMRAAGLTDKTAGPYPVDQVDHILSIRQRQDRGEPLEPHQPPWNVVLHTVPWGCGRHNHPACLVGHNDTSPNGGPLCPYLLAHRLPRDQRTNVANQLADTDPRNRGGAVNVPLGGTHPRQLTRSAPAFSGPGGGGELVTVPLAPGFVESVATGVGSKGMVYWGVSGAGPFFRGNDVQGEVFYTKQPGTAEPVVYGQVGRQGGPPRGGASGAGMRGGGEQQQQQHYMTPTVMDWPMYTGGPNAEGHYGPGCLVPGPL